jgi:hypothetical protein
MGNPTSTRKSLISNIIQSGTTSTLPTAEGCARLSDMSNCPSEERKYNSKTLTTSSTRSTISRWDKISSPNHMSEEHMLSRWNCVTALTIPHLDQVIKNNHLSCVLDPHPPVTPPLPPDEVIKIEYTISLILCLGLAWIKSSISM